MSDSWVHAGLIVYFIAGSTFLLAARKNYLVARIRAQRPTWTEQFCNQSVVVGRIAFVIFTLIITLSFFKQYLGGSR